MTLAGWGCAEGTANPLATAAIPVDSEPEMDAPMETLPASDAPSVFAPNDFVTRVGATLTAGGSEFRFAGANNYYLMYSSPLMVDDVLGAAARAGFNTMRTWGFLDIGNQDGLNSVRGPSNGVSFQYWGGSAPAYNDGPQGLERLDYIVQRAGQLGVRLVIPLVNNWNDFGGIDQYVRWRESSATEARAWFHDDFYTDPTIRQWYQDWLAHVIGRVNTLTGIPYRDDPTIAMWELGNEPRCGGAGVYPASDACTTQTLTEWADVMSTHIKSLDPNHLVSVGDEGFYCLEAGEHWTEQCGDGVDTVAFVRLPNIDVMSAHLYPEDWGTDSSWGTEWIARHIADAKANGKPSLIGEFGIRNTSVRNRVYHEWLDRLQSLGGNGGLYWILSGRQDSGGLYGDFDGFTIYEGTPTFETLTNFAAVMTAGAAQDFAPVADHDVGYLTHDTTAVFDPLRNDVAYGQDPATLSIDLDVEQAGIQSVVAIGDNQLEARPGGISFSPTPGFVGRVEVPYRAHDVAGRESNPAALSIVVSPDPVVLSSFEAGVEGWVAQMPNATRTVAQSSAFATDGTFGLEVSGTGNRNWFGLQLPAPADLSARRALTYDVQVGADDSETGVRVFFGDVRCQSFGARVPANTTSRVELDLINMTCDAPRPNARASSMYVLFSAGTFRLDNVQLQ
jgi:mannan endo-1,4-beta-mannosidase